MWVSAARPQTRTFGRMLSTGRRREETLTPLPSEWVS